MTPMCSLLVFEWTKVISYCIFAARKYVSATQMLMCGSPELRCRRRAYRLISAYRPWSAASEVQCAASVVFTATLSPSQYIVHRQAEGMRSRLCNSPTPRLLKTNISYYHYDMQISCRDHEIWVWIDFWDKELNLWQKSAAMGLPPTELNQITTLTCYYCTPVHVVAKKKTVGCHKLQ